MKSGSRPWIMETYIKRFTPKDSALPPEELDKQMLASFYLMFVLASSMFSHILFFTFISKYGVSLLLFYLIYHGIMLASILPDPVRLKYFLPFAIFYIMSLGPICLGFSNAFIGYSVLISGVLPLFGLFAFRSYKVAIAILLCEMLKNYFLYPTLLEAIVRGLDPYEIMDFLTQEAAITAIVLPPIFAVFHFLYQGYVENEQGLCLASKQLQASLKERETFILSLSHELKNPLNSMIGNTDLAIEEATQFSVRQKLNNSKICGEILLNLLNNILDAGKANLNSIDLCIAECRVLPFFERIWVIFKEIIHSRGLIAYFGASTRIPHTLMLDQHRLTQVLFNIIGNAVKFTKKGEIRFRISWIPDHEPTPRSHRMYHDEDSFSPVMNLVPREPELDRKPSTGLSRQFPSRSGLSFSFERSPSPTKIDRLALETYDSEETGTLVIQISDTGQGMSEEAQKHIFKKFVNNSSESHYRLGAGLGLWITKEICDKMKADIQVTSKLAEGTTFEIKLKCEAVMTKSESPTAIHIRKQTQHPVRAMIVDDEQFNAGILEQFCKDCGLQIVKIAKNGLEAVNAYEAALKERHPIHIITMDLEMPVMNGKEACEKIRMLESVYKAPPCSILIVSGNSIQTEVDACLDMNGIIRASHFLRKPVNRTEFEGLIQKEAKLFRKMSRMYVVDGKVLVASEDHFNLKFLESYLETRNIKSVCAKNGKEAVELYKTHADQIKMVFLDKRMDGKDGVTALQEIKIASAANKSGTPFFCLMIDSNDGKSILEYELIGADTVLKKPVQGEELLKAIQTANNL